MPRRADSLPGAIATLIETLAVGRRSRVKRRWRSLEIERLAEPQASAVAMPDRPGRLRVRCVVCGEYVYGRWSRGNGRPPATCRDPVCMEIRRIVNETKRDPTGIPWADVRHELLHAGGE